MHDWFKIPNLVLMKKNFSLVIGSLKISSSLYYEDKNSIMQSNFPTWSLKYGA